MMSFLILIRFSISLLVSVFFSIGVYAQEQDIILTINTNNSKLTEKENTDSKVLKILSRGEKVEFLGVVFPSGIHGAERYKVNYQGIEGFISSYFLQAEVYSKGQIIALKELKADQVIKYQERKSFVADSIAEIKRLENEAYLAKFKINEEEEIRKNDSIADAMLKKSKSDSKAYFAKIEEQNARNLIERKQKFIPKYGQINGEKVAKGLIWIGMSEEMLLDSWGKPNDINQTVTRYGSRKQYIYSGSQYVYVVNGIVDAWQD
jgi:hypothetical protein